MAKSSTLIGVMAIVVSIAAVVYVLVAFNFVGPDPGRTPTPLQSVPSGASTTNACAHGTTISLNAVSFNPLNSSTSFNQVPIRIVPGQSPITVGGQSGEAVATGTLAEGTTLSFTTIAIPCTAESFSGTIYMLSGTVDQNSAAHTYAISGTGKSQQFTNTHGDELRLTIRNLQGLSRSANQSASVTEEGATAMSAGDVREGTVDVEPGNVAFTAYGGQNLGVFWAYDSVDSAAFTDNSLSISSDNVPLTEIDCNTYPKANSVLSANRCWWSPTIDTETGLSEIRWRLANDGGSNAGGTSDPTLDLCDVQYVEQTGAEASTIRIDCYDSAGTDVGQTVSTITWDNS